MARRRARLPQTVDLNTAYGFSEDLRDCYRELAARGRDRLDEQAAVRLLFNHVTVKGVTLRFFFSRHDKLGNLLARKRKLQRETLNAALAREEADDFLAWVIANVRYSVLCNIALCAENWESFPRLLAAGDGLRNLMFDYLREKVRQPAFQSIDDMGRSDNLGRSRAEPRRATGAGPAPLWLTAQHIEHIRLRVELDVKHDKDRQRSFALYLLSLPYVGEVDKVSGANLRARFPWLQPGAEDMYERIRRRWLERLALYKKREEFHLLQRQRCLDSIYNSQRSGTENAEESAKQQRARQLLCNAGRCEQNIQNLYGRLVDESELAGLLGLGRPMDGRNVRKRASRRLCEIIQEVTGRKPPAARERRRLLMEEDAGLTV